MIGVLIARAQLAVHPGPAHALSPRIDPRRGRRFGLFERAAIDAVRDAVVFPEQVVKAIVGDDDRRTRLLLLRRRRTQRPTLLRGRRGRQQRKTKEKAHHQLHIVPSSSRFTGR